MPHTALGHIHYEQTLAKGYSAADVTVLPTLEDNLPNVILESAACGTPIVSFDSGGCGGAVVDGITGCIVERGNVQKLTEAVERIRKEDMSGTCRAYANQHFSLSKQGRNYLDLFDTLSV